MSEARTPREAGQADDPPKPDFSGPEAKADEVPPVSRRWRNIPATLVYPILGAFLGLGAPLGLAALRLAIGKSLKSDLAEHGFFYAYALAGSCLVFALGGLLAGLRADRLRRQENLYHALSDEDFLTRLPNMRAFENRYRRALERAVRFREPLSLLLVDVDRLKSLNDEFGHEIGSAALRHLARILEASKRQEDLAARWGGDEFVVLMPGADGAAAERVGREILGRMKRRPFADSKRTFPFTVTIGAATASSGAPAADLFEQADRALLKGKSAGGDRLQHSRPDF